MATQTKIKILLSKRPVSKVPLNQTKKSSLLKPADESEKDGVICVGGKKQLCS